MASRFLTRLRTQPNNEYPRGKLPFPVKFATRRELNAALSRDVLI